jgi:hypothetical protein
LISLKSIIIPIILIGIITPLQEAIVFEEEENKTVHYFTDEESLFKCEGGFYSEGQILKLKDQELDWI